MNLSQMSFDSGILHLANWVGNVIMPTMAAVFIIVAIIQFSKGQEFSHSMYGALACLGLRSDASARNVCLTEVLEQPGCVLDSAGDPGQLGRKRDPARVRRVQVAIGALRMGMFSPIHPASGWMRHFLAAGLCLMVSGLLRLAEFFVEHGTGGVT